MRAAFAQSAGRWPTRSACRQLSREHLRNTAAFCAAQKMTQLPARLDSQSAVLASERKTGMSEKFGCSAAKGGAERRILPAILLGVALSGATACACHAQCVEFSDRAPRADLDTFTKAPSSLFERLRNNKEK